MRKMWRENMPSSTRGCTLHCRHCWNESLLVLVVEECYGKVPPAGSAHPSGFIEDDDDNQLFRPLLSCWNDKSALVDWDRGRRAFQYPSNHYKIHRTLRDRLGLSTGFRFVRFVAAWSIHAATLGLTGGAGTIAARIDAEQKVVPWSHAPLALLRQSFRPC